jgi:hypothetical protein
MHRSKQHHYSITSSARASSDGGISRPSAFAVVRLMTRSNLVAAFSSAPLQCQLDLRHSLPAPLRRGHFS